MAYMGKLEKRINSAGPWESAGPENVVHEGHARPVCVLADARGLTVWLKGRKKKFRLRWVDVFTTAVERTVVSERRRKAAADQLTFFQED